MLKRENFFLLWLLKTFYLYVQDLASCENSAITRLDLFNSIVKSLDGYGTIKIAAQRNIIDKKQREHVVELQERGER